MPVHLLWGMTRDGTQFQPGTSIYRPVVEVLHPIPEIMPQELIPGMTAKDQETEFVPKVEAVEPLPDADAGDLRPSIWTEEDEDE